MKSRPFARQEDDLIAQALDSKHPWFAGVTKERLEREGMVPLALPKNERGESLPFSSGEWFQTPDRRARYCRFPSGTLQLESQLGNLEAAAKFR